MKKLSIIVPVYNVEQYLKRCVDSLIEQDFETTDYEIIMVNDGSTDNSQIVAERLVRKYANVSLYNQENLGLSGARNTGMLHAQGKYIMFVDSDDYLEYNCLKRLIGTCEENELDVCHFRLKWLPGNHIGSIGNLQFDKIYSGKEILRDGCLIGSACSNVYKSDLLYSKHLFFYQGITHQDVEFTTRLFCCATRIMIIEDVVYYYVNNPVSLSKDKSFEKENKYVCDAAVIGRLSKEYVKIHVQDEQIKDLVIRRINTSVITNLYSIMKKKSRPIKIVDNLIDAYQKNGLFPVWGKCISCRHRLMGLFLNNAYLYKRIYRFKRRKFES